MTLEEALAAAVPDEGRAPWAQAEHEGKRLLVIGYAAGRVLVEIDGATGARRVCEVGTQPPAGLAWEAVDGSLLVR